LWFMLYEGQYWWASQQNIRLLSATKQ
jgi:hypothetical protein